MRDGVHPVWVIRANQMNFRRRLLIFFVVIVVVPLIAAGVALFLTAEDNETGKADAELAATLRVGQALYNEERLRARGEVADVAQDPKLVEALAARDARAVEARLARLLSRDPAIASISVRAAGGRLLGQVGSTRGVASAAVAPQGGGPGRIALAVITADDFARELAAITDAEIRLVRSGDLIASTLDEQGGSAANPRKLELEGTEYRGRRMRLAEPEGPPLELAVYIEAEELSDAIADRRLLIAVILAAVLAAALAFSLIIARQLQAQVNEFLEAARRLGRGDFSRPVPVQGEDEFAALGVEFNRMSEQLELKIDEVERKRHELEDTIRRVGEAFAAGLDRQGIVDLAVRTAVEACDADAGRALPIDARRMRGSHIGRRDQGLITALEGAERRAFRISPENGSELLATLEDESVDQRGPAAFERDGVHALSVPLMARIGTGKLVEYVGVISIARDGEPFDEGERDLFGYLSGQAAVSIENADLHETVQRQAITDELTGLSNLRSFQDTLEREMERHRRFNSDIGLVMMDLDDFKRVNDTYGHQQGDVVLSHVASVLREHSRDIDEPARYGGEEMAVVLPETDLSGAELLAERMRTAIESLSIPRLDGAGSPLRVTASFGVASLPQSAGDKESLIAAADAALYRAKRSGKNRVKRAEASPTAS
jgi:diguanylate cyclase (GGDEF)-like protein